MRLRASASTTALRWLVVLVVTLFARAAAADNPELTVTATPQVVEVGDLVSYQLKAMVHEGPEPRDAQPGPLAGLSVRATTTSPMRMVSVVNGVRSDLVGVVATWHLRADKVGTFTLGPPSVSIGGVRRAGQAVRIRVVEKGQAPKRRSPDPLDPFRGLFDWGDEPSIEPAPRPADPKLGLETERAPIAFLHATIDKTRAVVGEQVTLSVLLYEDPQARQSQPRDVHEPSATDFVKKALMEDETRTVDLGAAMVGDRLWSVKLVRKTALFPLKAGRLAVEPMSMTLPQARVGLRESERLFVDVTEPPLAGRPPGYALGDVGDMSLSASVAPRSVEQDGAVGVTLELRGTGNLPAQLAPPVAPGIEWLDAQTRDKLGAAGSDRFGGTRTFSYVVRLHKEGAIDLGEVRLPFWDPDKRVYGVARAALGIIDVKRGAARDAGAPEEEPLLPDLPRARRVLEGEHAPSYLADRPLYWGALFGSPALCGLFLVGQRLLRRARDRRAAVSASPARLAKVRRAEAEALCIGDDAQAAMGAIARAVEATVLWRTGVNVRGGAAPVVVRDLVDAGITEERATALVALLRECEDARFSPDGMGPDAPREAWSRAKATLDELEGAET